MFLLIVTVTKAQIWINERIGLDYYVHFDLLSWQFSYLHPKIAVSIEI